MNMPELPATFSTIPRVDYNQESDTDEFEKALAENAQQVRKEATALERNASDGTGMPDGNASDNDFECGPSASKKHKNTQSSMRTSTNPNPLHELPPDFEFAVGHTFFCTLNEMKVFSKKWVQLRQAAEQAVLGGAVTNTEKERSKKRRASSSFKCDCEFKLKFKWDPTHNVCTCLQANLIHTNGCSPSMLQNEICKARSGQNILRLSKFLAVTLNCLFRGKAKPCCIRDVIRQHCVLSEETPITPQMLINIKLCLDRMGSKILNFS